MGRFTDLISSVGNDIKNRAETYFAVSARLREAISLSLANGLSPTGRGPHQSEALQHVMTASTLAYDYGAEFARSLGYGREGYGTTNAQDL
jgi:hypothetical protein